MVYDKLFITNLPSFYKINLYNKVSENVSVCVVFTGDDGESRNSDFFSSDIKFDALFFKKRNLLYRVFYSIWLCCKLRYKEIILGGWDSLPLWVFLLFSRSNKISVVVESSYIESSVTGLKGILKKIFIKKVKKNAYVSGEAQKILVERLCFRGNIVKTKGVGIFNYIKQPPFVERLEVKNFLFVGRLVEVKNLVFLISVFNKLPHLTLKIVGFGKQEAYLKSIASSNIIFYGAINNKKLSSFYQENDVFILPSKSEVWGLVVEEALNNGMPVLVSNCVGCAAEIINDKNGMVFKYDSEKDLLDKIDLIRNIDYYNKLRRNISKLDFDKIEQEQVNCYL